MIFSDVQYVRKFTTHSYSLKKLLLTLTQEKGAQEVGRCRIPKKVVCKETNDPS